jgi:tape measure domain-containing protein
MALDRTFIELTVKTVGEKAISDLSKELSVTRNEAKKAIQELFGFKKAEETIEDFNEAVLNTENGIKRYVRFLERQRGEVRFLGADYQNLTASIVKYQNALKEAQSQGLANPLSAEQLRTEQGLEQEIKRLERLKYTVDGATKEYAQLREQIQQYQQQLKQMRSGPEPEKDPINPRTLGGLRQAVQELEALREKADSGGELFQQFGQQIAVARRELERLARVKLLPAVEPGVLAETEQQIDDQIAYLRQERREVKLNSEEYHRLTAEIKQYQQQLRQAQNPQEFFPASTPRGMREEIAARREALDRMDFFDPQRQGEMQGLAELERLLAQRTKLPALPVPIEELDTYGGKLRQIQYLQEQLQDTRFSDGSYARAAKEINDLETQLKEAREAALGLKEVIKPAPVGSERWFNEEIKRLSELRSDLDITSDKYQAFTREIQSYQKQLEVARNGEQPGAIRSRLLGAAGALGATSLFGGGIISGLGAGAGYLAGGQAGAFAAAGIAQSLQMTVMPATELAAQVSRLNKVLSEESGAEYAKNLEFIRNISVSTGQTLPDATQQFLKLNAAVKAAGGSTETARGVYEAISGAIVKFGGSAEQVNGALNATTQIFSKGKVQAEELSGQIGERLVGAYVKFAQANGWTTKQLSKFLEEGEVTLDQFLKFADFIQKDGIKALEEYAKSAEGAGSRFNAAFSQFQVKIGQALLPAGAALQDFGVQLLGVAGDAIVKLVDAGKKLVAAFQAIPKPVTDATVALVAFLGAWKLFSVSVAAVQGLQIVAWFGGLTTAIATTGGLLPAAKAAFDAFWISVTGPVGATAAVVAGLAAIGVALYQNNQDFRDWVNAVGQIISEDWKRGMDTLKGYAEGAADRVTQKFKDIKEDIKNIFGDIPGVIGSILSGVTKKLNDWYASLPPWVKGASLNPLLGIIPGGNIVAGLGSGFNQRVQQRVQANRTASAEAALSQLVNPLATAGSTDQMLRLLDQANRNDIQKSLPGQSGGDDDKKEKEKKAARDRALQDYFNKMLKLQKEAFDNQQAYDRQLFENRLRRQKEEFDRRTELARLSEEARVSGLGEGGKEVAGIFEKLNDRRRRDEAELFQLRQSYNQKLFQAEQKQLQDLFDKRQEAMREQAKDLVSPASGMAAGFDTFTAIARSMGLVVTSGYRPGDRGFHGSNQAKDYGGNPQDMLRFARYMAEEFGSQLKELIYTPLGFGIKDGKRVPLSFWGDAVNRNHYDHVHAAFTGAPGAQATSPARPANAPKVSIPRNVGDNAALRAAAAADLEAIKRLQAFQTQAQAKDFETALNNLKGSLKETFAPLDDAKKSADDQLSAAQNYFNLLSQGITPELKAQFDAIDKIAETERQKLTGMADELQLKIASTSMSEEERKQRQEQLDLIRARIRAQKGITDETKKTVVATKELEERNERIKELAGGIANSIGNGLTEAFNLVIDGTEDWGRSLQEIASGVLREIANQILQIMVIRPITNAISQFLPGFLGGIFPFANGGIMTADGPVPLRKYAAGGIATGPQLALYGEGSMNEAFVPLPDGRRIPVVMQGSGGGTSVVVNVDARGTQVQGNDANGQQLGRVISQAVQAELIRQKRPGGLLVGA